MSTLTLASVAFGSLIGLCEPCDPGAIVCPMVPTYDLTFELENAAEAESLPPDSAVAKENDDYQRLRATLALMCRSV